MAQVAGGAGYVVSCGTGLEDCDGLGDDLELQCNQGRSIKADSRIDAVARKAGVWQSMVAQIDTDGVLLWQRVDQYRSPGDPPLSINGWSERSSASEYVFVDGNLEKNPLEVIFNYLKTGNFRYFCSTVMPGPQLKQAIPFTKKIKANFPKIKIIWGGYFASNQYKVCMDSGLVDYIVNGPGDMAFPSLLDLIEKPGFKLETDESDLLNIKNLIFRNSKGELTKTAKEDLLNQDTLPSLPYNYLNTFYPVKNYLAKTFMGKTTLSYHSSMGCPFTCSFCGIVPIFNARWKGKSAENIYKDVRYFKEHYSIVNNYKL